MLIGRASVVLQRCFEKQCSKQSPLSPPVWKLEEAVIGLGIVPGPGVSVIALRMSKFHQPVQSSLVPSSDHIFEQLMLGSSLGQIRASLLLKLMSKPLITAC
jgi:hypothetical protein